MEPGPVPDPGRLSPVIYRVGGATSQDHPAGGQDLSRDDSSEQQVKEKRAPRDNFLIEVTR